MAEITTNEGGDGAWEMSDDAIIDRTIRELEMTGLVDASTIVYRKAVRFLYGYPAYDLDYRANVTAMRNAVAATGLHLLGRFAQVDYITSDVCIDRALAVAKQLSQIAHL